VRITEVEHNFFPLLSTKHLLGRSHLHCVHHLHCDAGVEKLEHLVPFCSKWAALIWQLDLIMDALQDGENLAEFLIILRHLPCCMMGYWQQQQGWLSIQAECCLCSVARVFCLCWLQMISKRRWELHALSKHCLVTRGQTW